MSFISELFGRKNANLVMQPLYAAIIAEGRDLDWYEQGAVPDTLDGRFDMIAAILCAVMIRLDQDEEARQEIAWLTELFVDDMEGQLRQIGIGDMVVGKRIKEIMGALGGRMGAYREGLTGNANLDAALTRNLYRDEMPEPAALAFTTKGFADVHHRLTETSIDQVISGNIAKVSS
ncbi:MAG: ubiquinol-cytochrome C chaperone family protein [Parasphingorhabdus sp.]|uniref:ubiquinol-cytochrome C chaperone family protein n=1 Tax=Parasphingorhabdus sp. TaxID=2709688 RepID=UPI00300143A1